MLLCLQGGCPVPELVASQQPPSMATLLSAHLLHSRVLYGLIFEGNNCCSLEVFFFFFFFFSFFFSFFFFLENQCFLSLEREILQSLIHLLTCVRSPSKVPRFSFLKLMRVTRGFRDLALSCHGFAHFAVLWFTTALPRWLSLKERRGQTDSRLGKNLFQKRIS